MAQTTSIFPKTKKIYKELVRSRYIDLVVKKILTLLVDLFSFVKGWYFPEKYSWEWKLEMLLNKYEKETAGLFKKIIKPGMIVVDIGAHIGYYTRLFSKLVGKKGHVYAFEADSDNFSLLSKNLKYYKNVSLINKAISDKDGYISFYKIKNSTGCHSMIQPHMLSTKITVPSIRLDSFLGKNEINKVHVIKIDIEGGEPYAFRGMLKLFAESKGLYVVSEFSPQSLLSANIQPEEFLKQILEYGFTIYKISDDQKLEPMSLENIKNLKLHKTGYANLLFKKN